jgi:transcription-repair coupling factor (superfamily II helicase)
MILTAIREELARLERHPALEGALGAIRDGEKVVHLAGLHETAKALVTAYAGMTLRRPVFFIVESNSRAEEMAEAVGFFCAALGERSAGVAALPSFDVAPWQGLSPHPDLLEQRAATLYRLASGQVSVVVAALRAALWRYREAEEYVSRVRVLERDAEVSLEDLTSFLRTVGYERVEMVELPGQYAVRGGIVDVFSPEATRPVRAELLGDSIESLREFEPRTQRSVGPAVRATVLPLSEFSRAAAGEQGDGFPGWEFRQVAQRAGSLTLFDLPQSGAAPVVLLDEPEVTLALVDDAQRDMEAVRSKSGDGGGPDAREFFWTAESWKKRLETVSWLGLEHLALGSSQGQAYEIVSRETPRFHGDVVAFWNEVKSGLERGESVMVAAASTGELERLADLCREYEVPYRLGETEEGHESAVLAEGSEEGAAAAVVLFRGPIARGVSFPEVGLTIHGHADLFDVQPQTERARRRPKTAGFLGDFAELKPGDFVVHVDHGIGQFDGLRQLQTDGNRGEFMLLRYADDARLYVPLERLDLVQSFRAVEGTKPALDKLGGTAWVARKARVRKSLEDMAEQLLKLYAQRKAAPGFAFSPDTTWQREFEDAFEFQETPDQETAIADIKKDMERTVPMDRLVCGDVGYGKTEVAMRAAFKAVADGKQVAVLAPTTVLVFQHFETFRRRFAPFPVHIEMLSRFRSAREQKEVLAELETGKVDIVIGTHRLLSKDVRFHDLGLLIVDEEQRFGVAHKEKIKELRKDVHALALSATPIPRTLHMSLAGLRDMSVMETPPKDRLAIQTVVAPFREELIRRAIEEELERKGQVYFIHNRVESIYSLAALVQKLVPRARVIVGHGQMSEKKLERVMLQFIRDEADVLVATTIVENGLDIPRANTMIVNRADRFGLAELYQLRGRVGRSNQRAYAYLLVPPEGSLSPLARRRLAALKEFSELGSGFRIAALDLELRGAGNLLGRQQHGHIAAVGFDLYCQMLERAVAALRGEAPSTELRSSLDLGLDIRIPQDYIPNENLRLRTYKRIAAIQSDAEKEDARQELADRFGPVPASVLNLLEYAVLKSMCERLLISSVERQGNQAAVRFHPETPLEPSKLVKLVRTRQGIRLDPSGVLWLDWQRGGEPLVEALRNLLLALAA